MQIKTLVDGVEIYAKRVKVNYTVTNHGEWVTAWDGYTRAVFYLYPHYASKLSTYAQQISQTFSFIQPTFTSRVISYNKAM